MDEPDDDLPVATVRPHTVVGHASRSRGALARWLRARSRSLFVTRAALLGVVVAAAVGMSWVMRTLAGWF